MDGKELPINEGYAYLYFKDNAEITRKLFNQDQKTVSNPFDKSAKQSASQQISLDEKLKRKNELQKFIFQYMEAFKAKLPKPHNLYVMGAMYIDITTKPENKRKTKDAQDTLNAFLENILNLPQEEYNKYFKELFGITPEEYKIESEQNPKFKIKNPSVDRLKTVTAVLSNRNNYTNAQIEETQSSIVQQRTQENGAVERGFNDAKDNQGLFRKGCSWLVDHSYFCTSTYDVLDAIGKDKKDIKELQQIAKSGNDFAFNEKYKQMTGVDFRIENFEKIQKTHNAYLQNSDTKKRVEASKNLGKPNNNYSLDYFEDKIYDPTKYKPKASPLELAMFEYFGGKKNSYQAVEATKSSIKNAIKNFGLEKADAKTKYEALEKEWIRITEEKKKNFPDYKNEKKYKEEYEQSIKDAYGKNIAKDTLENYVSNVETTYGLAKTAAVIGTAVATGGSSIVASAAVAAGTGALINTTEEATDKDGLTSADMKNIGVEAAIEFGAFAVGGAVAKGVGNAIGKSAETAMKTGKPNMAVNILGSRATTGAITGSAMGSTAGAFSGTVETILNTPLEDLTFSDVAKNGIKSAVSGGIFGGLFGAAMGKWQEWKAPKDLAVPDYTIEQRFSIEDLKTKLNSSDISELRSLAEKVNNSMSKTDLAKIKLEVAKKVHPDVGGSQTLMQEYNAIFDNITGKTHLWRPGVNSNTQSAQNAQPATSPAPKANTTSVAKTEITPAFGSKISEPVSENIVPATGNINADSRLGLVPTEKAAAAEGKPAVENPFEKPVETPYAEAAAVDTAAVLKDTKPVADSRSGLVPPEGKPVAEVSAPKEVSADKPAATDAAATEGKPAEVKPDTAVEEVKTSEIKTAESKVEVAAAEKTLPKTQEEIIEYLKSLKDKDGKPRIPEREVKTFAKYLNPDNIEFFDTIMSLKFSDGRFRYSHDVAVKAIIKQGNWGYGYTNEHIKPLLRLAELKDGKGKYIFYGEQLSKLVSLIDSESKFNLLEHILSKRTSDGELRVFSFNIPEMLKLLNEDNIKIFDYFMDAKDAKGNFKYSDLDTQFFLEEVNKKVENDFIIPDIEQQMKMYDHLLSLKDSEGKPLLSDVVARKLFLYVNDKNLSSVERLLNIKRENFVNRGITYKKELVPRFSAEEMAELLSINKDGEATDIIELLANRFGYANGKDISMIITELYNNVCNKEFKYGLSITEENISDTIIKEKKDLLLQLLNMKKIGNTKLSCHNLYSIMSNHIENIKTAIEFYKKYNIYIEPMTVDKLLSSGTDPKILVDRVAEQKELMFKEPEKYVNGELNSENAKIILEGFFENNNDGLFLLSSIFDKDSLNNLLRLRLNDAKEYINIVRSFGTLELEVLQKLCNSTNMEGKPFVGNQKIEFIDLVEAYKQNELSFDKMKAMAETGKVDIEELNKDLFTQILKNSGMTDEQIAQIPPEKMMAWNKKYIHLLSKEIRSENSEGDTGFSDIFKAGNLEPDFERFIHDTSNGYGQANAKTRETFSQQGLDYEKWLHPSRENEVPFLVQDKNMERLTQIGTQLTEDIETLRANSFIKKTIDRQFPKCIKEGKFFIPTSTLSSKAKLTEFVQNIIKQLDGVWTTARGSLENPQRAAKARNTLTVLDHLNQRISDIAGVADNGNAKKTLDLTIKMWDRNPQKDIFQGNYSTCCIAMGGGNGAAMPHYIMNGAYNMIEMVDNRTGRTIGNALCYFVKGADGKPAFIIDNIEINNAVKPSEEVGIQLRKSITEYASRVAKEVTGKDDVPVYMSGSYNDVPCADLPKRTEKVSFMGNIDCDQIYMDLYSGWVENNELTKKVNLLKLK